MSAYGVFVSIFTTFFDVESSKKVKLPPQKMLFLLACIGILCFGGDFLPSQASNNFFTSETALTISPAGHNIQADEAAGSSPGHIIQVDEAADNSPGHIIQVDEAADNSPGHIIQADGATDNSPGHTIQAFSGNNIQMDG